MAKKLGETLCRGLCLLSKSLTQQEAIQHNFLKTIKSKQVYIYLDRKKYKN